MAQRFLGVLIAGVIGLAAPAFANQDPGSRDREGREDRRERRDWAPRGENDRGERRESPDGNGKQPPADGAGRPQRREHSPEFERWRERFKNMTPEERESWNQSFRMWMELPMEQKEGIIHHMEFLQRKAKEETERAMIATGLELNDKLKVEFEKRYRERRRRLEMDLRAQFDEIRKPRLQELIEDLKKEFAEKAATEKSPNGDKAPQNTPAQK